MLDKLQIRDGDSVLEIGAASGWNAAMMGRLVGETGSVHSVEIIGELADLARDTIAGLGIPNVTIVEGDGADGYAAGAPYDKIMFTVGSYDIPKAFYQQIKEGGHLLMVLKKPGFGDTLYLFRKVADHFESIDSMACSFVQMKGKTEMPELAPIVVDSLDFWEEIKGTEVTTRPFWCGGKSTNNAQFILKTTGLVSYLGIAEPLFTTFESSDKQHSRRRNYSFAVVDRENRSVAILSWEGKLTGYGNTKAFDRFWKDIQDWVELGMPNAPCFELKAYPAGVALTAGERQWITRRRDSQFLWTL
jgi:protein-L-isoaspartate O-methyltransferase